jgi:hypothetical protein
MLPWRSELKRRAAAHETASRCTVVPREEVIQRHRSKVGIGVPRIPVGKGELRAFGHKMDVIRREKAGGAQRESFEEAQLLEEDRSLAPWPAFGHSPALEISSHRFLMHCLELGKVDARKQAAMGSP